MTKSEPLPCKAPPEKLVGHPGDVAKSNQKSQGGKGHTTQPVVVNQDMADGLRAAELALECFGGLHLYTP